MWDQKRRSIIARAWKRAASSEDLTAHYASASFAAIAVTAAVTAEPLSESLVLLEMAMADPGLAACPSECLMRKKMRQSLLQRPSETSAC